MERVRQAVENGFGRWSGFVAGHPWKVIFCMVILNTLFGIQLISQIPNNDIFELYVAHPSHATKARDMLLRHFPDTSGHNFEPNASYPLPLYAEVIISEINGENVLSENTTLDIDNLIQEVTSINITSQYGENSNYMALCAQNEVVCVVEGRRASDLDCLGGVTFDNGTVTRASYRKVRFYLRQDSAMRKSDSIAWMEKFIQFFDNFNSDRIQVVYSHSLSFYVRLNDDTYIDIRFFGLSFTIFITICSFVITGGDCLSKRTHIGRMGIIVTPLSVMGAWGFLAGCGAEFTNMNGVMPFIALCKSSPISCIHFISGLI